VRLGISLTTDYSGYDDVRLAAGHAVARARAAEAAGLDSLFVGDHHVTPHPYLQNVPILARMLAEWGDRPAGCLFLLPLWHPVLLAEQVGTLAAVARDRFILQCGIGTGAGQFAGMGVNPRTRPSAFEESLDICRRLWAGETVTSQGRFRIESARISPRPPEPVEVWVACGPAGLDRAARVGDGWLSGPGSTFEGARGECDRYRERCAAHGRTPSAIALRRDVYVGADEADAEAVRRTAVEAGYRGFPPEALITGTVDQVAEQLARFATLGVTDVLVRHLTNDQRLVLGSIERLAAVRQQLARAG
jgi:alkanesulfonate monooxygenase SsuD/methylene tetrahydromethanopterin reductase-like flavin-dependent oxidoreductase (luciferase family)